MGPALGAGVVATADVDGDGAASPLAALRAQLTVPPITAIANPSVDRAELMT